MEGFKFCVVEEVWPKHRNAALVSGCHKGVSNLSLQFAKLKQGRRTSARELIIIECKVFYNVAISTEHFTFAYFF